METIDGKILQVVLPVTRVFEDLEPRLAEINGDNRDEIIVVESDTRTGASLSVYSVISDSLRRIAATPFLGRSNRWLNPLGVGDFDGDDRTDIALVATPHIGGRLRLYRLKDSDLILFAEYSGVSTHSIGSTELGLGCIIPATPRDRFLIPDQAKRALMLLEWTTKEWIEITRTELPGSLVSSLEPSRPGHWRFRLENGKYYEIHLTR